MFGSPRKLLKKAAGFAYILGVIFIVTSLVMSTGIVPASAAEPLAPQEGNCSNFDVKIERPPWSYTDPNGTIIAKVVIKAGSDNQGEACFTFGFPPSNQNDGCYSVSGLGTTSISASKIGSGPECKDISHLEIKLKGHPTETSTPEIPTPTNTPVEPTPTNTPVEPTPTNTPVEPTPTNTPVEPTPTNTPVEPTPTNTPKGPTPTNTPVEPTPTNTPKGPTPTNTPVEPTPTNTPVEPTPTNTPVEPTPTNTPVEPTPTPTSAIGTPEKTEQPTKPAKKNTATPVPTVPAPDSSSDVLIPVTGFDMTMQQSQSAKFISNLGFIFFGLGIVLQGLSMKKKDEDENE